MFVFIEVVALKDIKYIFFFVIYVALHFVEGLPDIGDFSVAQLWKLPIMLLLIFYVIFTWKRVVSFELWTFALMFESLFCIDLYINPVSTISAVFKLIPCVLIFHYLTNSNKSQKTLKNIILFFSRSICLTSLITLLDILKPLRENKDASMFGIEGATYYTSLFGAPHAASSYFAIAIVTLVFFLVKVKRISKFWVVFDIAMIIIALISVFKAYVRTGWLMVFVGLVSLFGLKNVVSKRKYFVLFCLLVVFLCALYYTNEMFHARMTGVNVYSGAGGDGINMTGSGRISFWMSGLELWTNGDPYELLFGQGYYKVTENNYSTVGMRVFSHNQFVDALAQHGVIGLVLLILLFISQYRFIVHRKESLYYRLCLSIFFMTMTFAFFQSLIYFDYAIIYAACLAVLTKKNKIKVVKNECRILEKSTDDRL